MIFEQLRGKTLRADVDERGVTLGITDQALEAQDLGARVWRDLVSGFSEGKKDSVAWRETYKLLCWILYVGYTEGGVDLKQYLEQAKEDRAIQPEAFEIGSFREIYEFVLDGGDLDQIDMDLKSLHTAAAAIYYLVLPPGTRDEAVRPDLIGLAATTRL